MFENRNIIKVLVPKCKIMIEAKYHSIQNLQNSINELQELSLRKAPELSYHQVMSAVFDLVHQIYYLEKEGMPKAEIKELLILPKQIIGQSHFFKHAQTWPRGYQGDFEMIEYIMNGENAVEKGTIGYYIEEYGLNSPASQQHRNKIAFQSHKILEKYFNRQATKTRILSIACGSSPDFRAIKSFLNPDNIEIVLLDSDPDAIKYSLKNLKEIKGSLDIIVGNIFRNLIKVKKYGKFDLVIIGGLFDYLPDNLVVKILKNIKTNNLNAGGEIIFTNISLQNIDRIFMEYLVDWELITRSSEDLMKLSCEAGFGVDDVSIARDRTNLTFLVNAIN